MKKLLLVLFLFAYNVVHAQTNTTEEFENGKIPKEYLKISKYLNRSFPDTKDERKLLLYDAAENLDRFLDAYHLNMRSAWPNVTATNGYNNYNRQVNSAQKLEAGKSPFGFANQVELYFGLNKGSSLTRSACIHYLKTGQVTDRYNETHVLDWLVKNSKLYGYKLADITSDNSEQLDIWIFDPSLLETTKHKN